MLLCSEMLGGEMVIVESNVLAGWEAAACAAAP